MAKTLREDFSRKQTENEADSPSLVRINLAGKAMSVAVVSWNDWSVHELCVVECSKPSDIRLGSTVLEHLEVFAF